MEARFYGKPKCVKMADASARIFQQPQVCVYAYIPQQLSNQFNFISCLPPCSFFSDRSWCLEQCFLCNVFRVFYCSACLFAVLLCRTAALGLGQKSDLHKRKSVSRNQYINTRNKEKIPFILECIKMTMNECSENIIKFFCS